MEADSLTVRKTEHSHSSPEHRQWAVMGSEHPELSRTINRGSAFLALCIFSFLDVNELAFEGFEPFSRGRSFCEGAWRGAPRDKEHRCTLEISLIYELWSKSMRVFMGFCLAEATLSKESGGK